MQTRISEELWWKGDKGTLHRSAFATVRRLENEQGAIMARFPKLETLYDPNNPDDGGGNGGVTENVIATGVDTVSAIVATANIRARFMTDGADWSQTRRARHLEFYAEELANDLKILPKCRRAFKESVKKGTGLTKASRVFGKPRLDFLAVENVVVDGAECRDGHEPKQFHHWDVVDADELCARFPKFEEQIERARGRTDGDWRRAAVRYALPVNGVTVLYSWRLPVGVKGEEGYRAGREAITISDCDLFDAEYHEQTVPISVMVWSERLNSFYGISGAERVMGIQRSLSKRNWQIERTLDQSALITTYIRPADAGATAKTTELGNYVQIKGDWPQTPAPPVVHPETYQSRIQLRASGLEELGVNQMAAHATKPAGVDSGRAIQEYTDATTVRYAPQEIAFEDLVLDSIWQSLMQCKKLGKKAPKMIRRGRFGARTIKWDDVDPREMRIQMQAASNTTRMPWGRAQTAIELAQGGIISTDSARRMLVNLDIDQELSLYMAALESIEGDLDDIADGEMIVPEPFTNAEMAVWRGQNEYLKWARTTAPEEVLEVLRQYIELAADITSKAQAGAANQNMPMADPMAMPMDPGAMPMPGAMPPQAQPQAAFADQAMDLMTG